MMLMLHLIKRHLEIMRRNKMKENDKKDIATESKDPLREILDNYKNNIVGKPVSNTEAAEAWMNTMVAFAKEVIKMEEKRS
jgi:hypothetical protein